MIRTHAQFAVAHFSNETKYMPGQHEEYFNVFSEAMQSSFRRHITSVFDPGSTAPRYSLSEEERMQTQRDALQELILHHAFQRIAREQYMALHRGRIEISLAAAREETLRLANEFRNRLRDRITFFEWLG